MTAQTDTRRYTTVLYTDRKGKKHTYEVPERFMGYALLGRFDGDVMAFMAWWHEQAQHEKAFKRQRAAERRRARKAA